MKVVVQIPCLNEEQTLPLVLASIPKKIPGVDQIEVLVIDDGSTDETVKVAREHGVKHFVSHPQRKGLARSFHDGINKALEMGADIIINTDGDNQYPQERIGDLVQPILKGQADIVIADRQVQTISHFSPIKKLMQRVGTHILNAAAGTAVPDAPSGFRAYSREVAMQLNVVTRFSYAMETIIQAGNKNFSIVSIPITTNPKTRESRLFKNSFEHIHKSGSAIIRAFIMYKPVAFFVSLGAILFALGLIPFGRFMYFLVVDDGRGHIQSLVVGSVFLIAAFISFALGIIADLIRINRVLIEDLLEQSRRHHYDK
ncbi:MAG TPA: glycosyltransferase family 2 protein [Candidatus Saccharimonadales bacterium]